MLKEFAWITAAIMAGSFAVFVFVMNILDDDLDARLRQYYEKAHRSYDEGLVDVLSRGTLSPDLALHIIYWRAIIKGAPGFADKAWERPDKEELLETNNIEEYIYSYGLPDGDEIIHIE